MKPLPRLAATTFFQPLPSGRSKPCLVGCVDAEGNDAGEYVIKLRGGMEARETALTAEIVSHHLANLFGVATPPAAVITVSKEFASSIPAGPIGDNFRASVCENFGSRYISPSYATWPVGKAALPLALVQAAVDLFAFDVLLNNPDRTWFRPNFLSNGEELMAIDHDMAFSFVFEFGKKRPLVEYCSAVAMPFLSNHALYNALKKRVIDLRRLEGALALLDAAAIRGIEGDIPQGWKNDKTGPILEYLQAVARRSPPFTMVAREVLA